MFSCRKASRLMSDGLDRDLGPAERTYLRLHLMICRYCRRAVKQLRFLQEVGRRWTARQEAQQADASLSEESRRRILERVNRE